MEISLLLNNTLFWIFIFLFQVYILSVISSKIFNTLYFYLHRIFKKDSTVVFVISMMFLPGTFIHELSHAISATLLGSRVTRFSIWPKIENGGIKMGYAQFIVLDIFRNTLIGISPLIFGILILYFLISNFFVVSLSLKILFLYLIFQVSNSMFLSSSDLKDFKTLTLVLVIVGFGVYFLDLYFLGLSIYSSFNLFNFLKPYLNFFIYLNLFFGITLVLNILILFFFKLVKKFF